MFKFSKDTENVPSDNNVTDSLTLLLDFKPLEDVEQDTPNSRQDLSESERLDTLPEIAAVVAVMEDSTSSTTWGYGNGYDTSVFTEECIRHVFEKNRPVNGGWKELLEVQSRIPSRLPCLRKALKR